MHLASITFFIFHIVVRLIWENQPATHPVRPRDVAVNGLVIAGTLVSVRFGPHETPAYDLDDLMRLVRESTFIMY
jgi:hypothetical protein